MTPESHDSPCPQIEAAGARRLFAFLRDEATNANEIDASALRIDGYVIHKLVGSGGGGSVYRAFQVGSDRPVALKVLSQRFGRAADAKRAWRELRIADLRLKCLPTVLDYGEHDGHFYIATEFVDGLPLDQHCEAQSLSRRDRVEILAKVGDAVQTLHERAVIHRDLKPSNILVTANGDPVIIDLGIAILQSNEGSVTLTEEGKPIGTPAFMSPEQASGERARISTRSDVYALGATAFKILTGETPHDTNTTIHEAVRRVVQDQPRDPRALDPSLPKSLAAVLGKACSHSPEHRYASAKEVAADLRRWSNGEPVEASPPSMWRMGTRWMGRHPVATTTIASVIVAGMVVGGTTLSVWWASGMPVRVRVLDDDGTRAQLCAVSGRVLREWGDRSYGFVRCAHLLRRPPEFGGGSVVVLGLQKGESTGVCCFDAHKPDHLLWSSGVGPEGFRIPPFPSFGSIEPTFTKIDCIVADDVFQESPGQEIVAILNHSRYGIGVVRIYSLKGDVLYEAWHRGHFRSVQWLRGPGLLGMLGWNSEVLWKCRGQPRVESQSPIIVAALRPTFGASEGWITTPSVPGQCAPVWYRCLLPPDVSTDDNAKSLLISASVQPEYPGDQYFRINAGFTELIVDASGRVVDSIIMATGAQQSATAGPSAIPGAVTLEELPPIDPGCELIRLPE